MHGAYRFTLYFQEKKQNAAKILYYKIDQQEFM